MPRLVSGWDVRTRLGLGNVDTFVSAADDASEEATLHLAADLRTPLLTASYSELWLLDRYDTQQRTHKLKTKAGFIDPLSFQIGTGASVESAQADTSLTAASVVDYEKGKIVVTDAPYYRYVSVRYDAGFALVPNDPDEMIDLTNVPAWLVTAAVSKAIHLMSQHPEFSNKETTTIDGKGYLRQYGALVTEKVRYLPGYRGAIQ